VVQRAEYRRVAATGQVYHRRRLFDEFRTDHFGVDAVVLVDLGAPAHGAQGRIGMRQGEVAAVGVKQIQVEFLRQILPQGQRLVVKLDPFRRQVVGTDDGGVASGVAAADIAFFQYRDVGDAMIASQIVGGRQPVAAAADDDHIVAGLEFGMRGKHPRFGMFLGCGKAEKSPGHCITP
jgi:hypothetical protein